MAQRNFPQQLLTLDHVSPATRLLEKRRQMFEVQEALDAQKEDFERREHAFQQREEALRKKDLALQESLIKFNKFLQENESKRNRAIKRAADEKKQIALKEQDIVRLQAELEECGARSKELAQTVARNKRYMSYLEEVQEHVQEDYPELQDLLNRFNTLRNANTHLAEEQRSHEDEHDSVRAEFTEYSRRATNDLFNQSNQVASLTQDLEHRERVKQRLQKEFETSIRATSDKTLEMGQVLLAVEHLLLRCTKDHGSVLKHAEQRASASEEGGGGGGSHGAAAKDADGAAKESQALVGGRQALVDLDVIGAYIVDFQSIVAEWKSANAQRK